jgi:hypothetical protein
VWEDGADNSSAAAQQHFARRYRTLEAQHDRMVEERTILRSEVLRTFNWYEEREEMLLAALGGMDTSSGGGVEKRHQQQGQQQQGQQHHWTREVAAGKAVLLRTELQRIRRMHAQAKITLSTSV